MRAKQFIIEYSRQITAQKAGASLVNALMKDTGPALPDNLKQLRKAGVTDPNAYQAATEAILSAIEAADPTTNKQYTPWLARVYARGGVRLEDLNRGNVVGIFHLGKTRKMINPEHADINRFKTYREFEDTMLGKYDLDQIEGKGKFAPEEVNKGKAKQVYMDETVRVIVPEDEAAACYYGQGTRWCTAATNGNNMFSTYARHGALYIMLPKKPKYDGEKYQLQLSTGQLMDELDDPQPFSMLRRFPGFLEFLRETDPETNDIVELASDETLSTVMEKIRDVVSGSGVVWDTITEYEKNDDYYNKWLRAEAIEKGFVDSDGDPDYERLRDSGEYSYLDYDFDLKHEVEEIEDILFSSPAELRAGVKRMMEWEDENEGAITMQNLDDLLPFMIRDQFPDSGLATSVADFISGKVWIRKGADKTWTVGVVKGAR